MSLADVVENCHKIPLPSKVILINPIAYWRQYARYQRLGVSKREQTPRGTI